MKSSEVASKYGLFLYEVDNYIKEHANFPFKESIFGTITFSDDVDVEGFIQPLLLAKKERDQKIIEKRLLQENFKTLKHPRTTIY